MQTPYTKIEAVKFYCHNCHGYAPVIMYPFSPDKRGHSFPTSQIVCQRCYLSIANVATDFNRQGKYDFVKIKKQ